MLRPQATFDKTYTHLGAGLAMGHGASLHAELLDAGITSSPTQGVLHLDLNEALSHYHRRPKADAKAVALEVIEEVGITDSHLNHAHTPRHCREVWYPRLLDPRVARAAPSRE